MTRILRLVAGLVLAFGVAACDDADDLPTGPTGPSGISPELRLTLERGLNDEYRAETTYQAAVTDFGPVQPFVLIIAAEQRHSTAIGQLFLTRGLPVPANPWTFSNVTHYPTVAAACEGGAASERANIALYDELLKLELPADVRQVFTNNRAASLMNHLPAFERCT